MTLFCLGPFSLNVSQGKGKVYHTLVLPTEICILVRNRVNKKPEKPK